MKYFYVYNNFFKIVIDANIITFYITSTEYNDISIYKIQLINLDQPEKIFKLENINLNLFEVQKLQNKTTQKVNKTTTTTLAAK